MKNRSKKALAVFLLFCFLILINIIPLLVFREKAQITSYSLIAVMLLIFVVIKGIDSYIFRHKGNYLTYARRGIFTVFLADRDYTFTPKYTKKFYRMLLVYCAAIPFYIPAIFFSSRPWHPLWAFLVFAAPQFVFFIWDAREFRSEVKLAKQKELERKRELEEQKAREELGRWK